MSETILPPLPVTEWVLHMPARPYKPEWTSSQKGYSAEQMLTYAAAAVAADRAHIRTLVEAVRDANGAASGETFRLLTAAQESAWAALMDAVTPA